MRASLLASLPYMMAEPTASLVMLTGKFAEGAKYG
jgi:hypothetical protein